MVVKVLTDELVQELNCPAGRTHLEVFDTEVKGFYLDLLCSGRKTYRVRYWLDAKKRLESIGDARLLSFQEARTLAIQTIQAGKLRPQKTKPRRGNLPGLFSLPDQPDTLARLRGLGTGRGAARHLPTYQPTQRWRRNPAGRG